jgi:hypothetical protein
MLREVAAGMVAVAGPKAGELENYLRNHTLLIRSMRDVDFLPVGPPAIIRSGEITIEFRRRVRPASARRAWIANNA